MKQRKLNRGNRRRQRTPQESAEMRILRKECERLRRKLSVSGSQQELVLDAVREVFEDWKPRPIPAPRSRHKRRSYQEQAVAHLSDLQWGKVTADYDSEIAGRRMIEYGERTLACIDAHRSHARVDKIHCYLGGDLVEGEMIFPGQAHEIDSSVLEQALLSCPDALAALFSMWLKEVKHLHVVGVPGNHGRPASRHAGSHPRTNWDIACMQTLWRMMRHEPRITWNLPMDFYAVNEVLGRKHLIVHGDQIRGGFAGFPWYGLGKKMAGWIDSLPEEWHDVYLGHFHTYTQGYWNGRFFFANGTPESSNTYARAELAAAGRPCQRFQFWSREHGLTADRPIYLKAGLLERKPLSSGVL